jgi:hypothetical protein
LRPTLETPVIVLDADDVVLTEIAAGLDLDQKTISDQPARKPTSISAERSKITQIR